MKNCLQCQQPYPPHLSVCPEDLLEDFGGAQPDQQPKIAFETEPAPGPTLVRETILFWASAVPTISTYPHPPGHPAFLYHLNRIAQVEEVTRTGASTP